MRFHREARVEKEREREKERKNTGIQRGKRATVYVFHGSEAKLRSCRDIAEIFKVAKKKKRSLSKTA